MKFDKINLSKKKYSVFYSLIIFFTLGILVVCSEIIQRQSVKSALNWLVNNFHLFLIATIILICIYFILLAITNKSILSLGVVFFTIFILSMVSYFKQSQRNEPLYFKELSLILKIKGVTDKSNIWFTPYLLLVFIILMLLVFLFYYLGKKGFKLNYFNLKQRLLMIGVFFTFGNILLYTSFFNSNSWNDTTYSSKGFVLGFVSHIFYDSTAELKNYNKPFLEDSIFKLKNETKEKITSEEILKPNVIIIMSESFWDITKIQNLELSKEPIPNFKALTDNYTNGNMASVTFGGGTANVEYEFLTGFLNRYFSAENSSYETYIKKNISALPQIFKNNGYDTTALHTYFKTFYSRDTLYDKLGFDKFIGAEDLPNPEYSGGYISDSYLTEMIIEEYEKKRNPLFLFAISMENHQPYNKNKYPETEIKILNDIDTETKEMTEAYIQGLHNADKELEKIVSYFEKQEEPSIIFFFGDHLPSLGTDFKFYRELGYVEKNGKLAKDELLKILTPPFVMWSNYDMEKEELPVIGSNFLGNYLLNRINIKKPLFFYYIDEAYKYSRYMSRVDLFVDNSNKTNSYIPNSFHEIDNVYKMYQYDFLLGNSYIADQLNKMY